MFYNDKMNHKVVGKGQNGIILRPPFNVAFSKEKNMVSKIFKNKKNFTIETFFYKDFFPRVLDPTNDFTLRYYGDFVFDQDDDDYDQRLLMLIKKELSTRKDQFFELVIEDGGKDLLHSDRIVPLSDLLRIVKKIHDKGVLHLDIYQDNIMFNGRIVLIDFELACKSKNLYTVQNEALFLSSFDTYKFPPEFRIASFILSNGTNDIKSLINEFNSRYRDDLYIDDLFDDYMSREEFYREYDGYVSYLLERIGGIRTDDLYRTCHKIFGRYGNKIDMYSLGLQLLIQNTPKNDKIRHTKKLINPNPIKRYSAKRLLTYMETNTSASSSSKSDPKSGGTQSKSYDNALKELKKTLCKSAKNKKSLEDIIKSLS